MPALKEKLSQIQLAVKAALQTIKSIKNLDQLRTEYLGKNGAITSLLKELKNLSDDDKKIFGPQINQLKAQTHEAFDQAGQNLIEKQKQSLIAKQQHFDVTAYQPRALQGHLHPYSLFIHEIEDIFLSMGYQILDGPEVETDFYNFTALNIPKDHPARDMYDTLWTDKPDHLLRTHTSTVQIHAMQTLPLPLAAIVPGRTFRYEAVDASHDFQFMQCEGLYIDKHVNLSHLFATAQTFLKTLFKKDELDIRIRPGFFPFVEPGFEIDMRCPFCTDGCSTCKKTTWMEVFPAGLIHPNVLKAGGIDPNEYSGFAFGFGLSRLVMLKYGIRDIRLLLSGDVKFLEQF
ncbi:MAG: phenylalanine--tRNA ligase subunit alpha [bacterium]